MEVCTLVFVVGDTPSFAHHSNVNCFVLDEESTVSATDVIANNISISAPSRQLLIDASLKLVSGRRYGLLGPNGR